MPTKEELLEQIDNKVKEKGFYSASEVKYMVNSVKNSHDIPYLKPNKIKVGDILIEEWGSKKRPSLVISVNKNYCVIVAMSTTKDYRYLCDSKSRFQRYNNDEQFINCDLSIVDNEYAYDRVVAVYDNNSHIREIKQMLKEKYKFLK